MNKKVKKDWLTALRSGDYKQGRGHLCQIDTGQGEAFCCLGVLYDIAYDGDWVQEAYQCAGPAVYHPYYSIDGPHSGALSNTFRTSLGITDDQESELIRMNDGGKGFIKIADYIEANL